MTKFVHHEPCPKCLSRDNVAVYSDGHKWCFGCGYYVPPARTLGNSRPKMAEVNRSSAQLPEVTEVIPNRIIKWLKQYDLTNEEISTYFMYSPERESLVYILPSRKGYLERFFTGEIRYSFTGEKDITFIGKGSTLVIVEDIVSAIKVGRQATSLCLFGSTIPLEALRTALEGFERGLVWLDRDKAQKAAQIASKGRLLTGKDVRTVITEKDPKYFSDEEIRRILC